MNAIRVVVRERIAVGIQLLRGASTVLSRKDSLQSLWFNPSCSIFGFYIFLEHIRYVRMSSSSHTRISQPLPCVYYTIWSWHLHRMLSVERKNLSSANEAKQKSGSALHSLLQRGCQNFLNKNKKRKTETDSKFMQKATSYQVLHIKFLINYSSKVITYPFLHTPHCNTARRKVFSCWFWTPRQLCSLSAWYNRWLLHSNPPKHKNSIRPHVSRNNNGWQYFVLKWCEIILHFY